MLEIKRPRRGKTDGEQTDVFIFGRSGYREPSRRGGRGQARKLFCFCAKPGRVAASSENWHEHQRQEMNEANPCTRPGLAVEGVDDGRESNEARSRAP